MRSPARAFAWEFRRHLWVLVASALYHLALTRAIPALFGPGQGIRLDPPDGMGALFVVPLSFAFFYFLAVFSYGLTGDLTARQSIYPRRLFTVPVTSAALAGWPMLFGATTMAALWLVTAGFARWSWGINVPLAWPALLLAVFLAWTQAMTWMPYGWPGVRVAAAVLWLATLDAIVILAVEYGASEGMMIALLAPQLPLAYWTACAAVARARRGMIPEWPAVRWPRQGHAAASRPRTPFASAGRAQAWFEWRRHGWSLPAMVALVVPFELGLLFVPVVVTPSFLFLVLLAVAVTPPVLAGFVAATLRQASPHASDQSGLTPLEATRPITTAVLVAAKLEAAAWSTLAAWLVIAALVPIALMASDTWHAATTRVATFAAYVGTSRAVAIASLTALAFIVSTWKRLVQSLYIGLTGRQWITRISGFTTLVLVAMIGPAFEWVSESAAAQRWLWDNWQSMLAALVVLKMTVAAWLATRLWTRRVLSDRALVIGAAAWMMTVLALHGVLVWLTDTPLISRALLGLFAIAAIPLARLSAAPLALAWNRHR